MYAFWEVADVASPAGPGWKTIWIYSDNHGEARASINGDADLTYDECASTLADAQAKNSSIIALTGFYCALGDLVGISDVTAIVNYPDKQGKAAPLTSDVVTIEWTWGGIKDVSIEAGVGPDVNYVVLHVTDRDGFCSDSPSLNPVLV